MCSSDLFTAGNYEMRGLSDGAPRRLGSPAAMLVADIFFLPGSARNHAGGANVLSSDGVARYVSLPASWNIESPGAWDELDSRSR